VSALDIGQGDAILLQHGPHAVLFDTGPPGAPVVKELRRSGVTRLDVLVITHSSADHGGGARQVLDAFPVGLVLDGRKAKSEHAHGDGGEGGGERFEDVSASTRKAVTEAGLQVRAGPIDVEVLWPPPGASRAGDPNLTATVAVARANGRSVLLTADAESDVLLPLDLPDVDVLKVSHHGSEDEGLPALLDEAKPEAALISVGDHNTYGHPHPSTLQALKSVPDVRRTDEDGTSRIALP
jgi:competence protein ComEC